MNRNKKGIKGVKTIKFSTYFTSMIFPFKREEARAAILSFLKQDELLRPRKDESLKALGKAFSKFESCSSQVFDELARLSSDEPGVIIEATKAFFNKKGTLTKVLDSSRRREINIEKSVIDKVSDIANLYESVSILNFPAYLLSSRRAPLSSLNEEQAILKYFQQLDISKQDREKFRLLRNSFRHGFSVESNKIVTTEGKRIANSEIDELYQKFENIVSWWMTFAIFNLWYLPRFGVLVSLGIYFSIVDNSDEWEDYAKGIQTFYSDVIERRDKEKKKKEELIQTRIRKGKKRIRNFIEKKFLKKIIDSEDDKFVFDNVAIIIDRIEYHLSYLFAEVETISKKVGNLNDQRRIISLANWLKKGYITVKEVADFYRNNQKQFLELLKNSQKRKGKTYKPF